MTATRGVAGNAFYTSEQAITAMAIAPQVIDDERERTLDYEKDPRFVRYMKMRLEKAIEDREAGLLVDADVVFANIRDRYGW